jgi:uncharacterized protein (TIGR03000 family)
VEVPETPGPTLNAAQPPVIAFKEPALTPQEKALPINLATALRLANAQAWDIGIASQQIRVAAAQLTRANVLWLPTLAMGADYMHNSGPVVNSNNTLTPTTANSLELGGAPEMVFTLTEAIFEPLAARQTMKARKADLQTATNDTTYLVARGYFDIEEARGNLAGVQDTIRRTKDMLRKIEKLAPELVPTVEVARARAQLAQFEQNEDSIREQGNVVSSSFVRIVRLDPSAMVVPLEPPHLQITLVAPEQPIENLLAVALAARPELVAYQALSQAALKRWREEQFRPALPAVYFRGASTQLPDSMMFGAYTGGGSGSFGNFRARADYEVAMMWEFRNLGFGNAAAMKERHAEYDVTRMQAFRLQDSVAAEVAEAYARVRSARARVTKAERELREAEISAQQNYLGLGELNRIGGNIVGLVIRPQEALASMQALLQGYRDYYGAIADYNRSQFQLYRALGNPAQVLPLLDPNNPNGNLLSNPNPSPPPPAAPPVPGAPAVPNAAGVVSETNKSVVAAGVTDTLPANAVLQVSSSTSATMVVRVPVNAEVYCDGVKMSLTGSERKFVSPPLPTGRTFPYEIRAHWVGADGKPIDQTRLVQVQAGQRTLVDFLSRGTN